MTPPRALAVIVLSGIGVFTALTAFLSTNFDFRAFYCAGNAVRAQANPYHTEPLHECERTRTDVTFRVFFENVALPAPQPGYDIAAFAALAAVPFALASRLWTALLLASALATIMFVRRLSGESSLTVVAALWLSLCLTSLYLGETIPLCLCAIAAGAFCARTSRWGFTGIAAAATLIEPHIGVPVCLSVALWAPRARVPLAMSAAGLVTLSLAVLGLATNIEYFVNVLPAHAVSEINSDAQLSIAALLHAAGVPVGSALRAGTLQMAATLVASTALAGYFAHRFRDDAFLVAFPAAFAVIGGVFMHVTELAAALPLLFLLRKYAVASRALTTALILLSVPWWSLATPMLFGAFTGTVLAGVTVFALAYETAGKNAFLACALALASGAALTGVLRWHDANAIHDVLVHAPASVLRAAYPESSWRWFNDTYMATNSLASWVLRGASWAGLAIIVYASSAVGISYFRTRQSEIGVSAHV